MSKSIAELRASTYTALPERTISICLAQKLVAEVQALDEERAEIVRAERGADGEAGRPRRQGEGANPRIAEIEARFDELAEEMREHTGELRVRAIPGGEWRRWSDLHPAREAGRDEKGQPIPHPVDDDIAYGFVNGSDLFANLDTFVVSWNGDPLAEGDWDFIANRAAPGDLKEVCRTIVQMHELVGAKAPLSLRPSSKTTLDVSASNSPSN